MGWVTKTELYERLNSVISDSDYSQFSAHKILNQIANPHTKKLLDFGCGEGQHEKQIRKMGFRWFGIDLKCSIKDSVIYNGINLPFESESFDVIFTSQVMEHLEFSDLTLKEVNRVLKKSGVFCGSFSYLEPFHSSSTFNITPLGLKILLERNGFQLERLFPGLDCISVIVHRILGRSIPNFLKYLVNRIVWQSKESPLNRVINLYGRLQKLTCKEINAIKIILAGHLYFLAKKKMHKDN